MDLEAFRLKSEALPGKARVRGGSRARERGWFLKGPIPGRWLNRVFALHPRTAGRALRVGLALWYLAGVKRTKQVKPSKEAWQYFRLSAYSGRRGLADLERAGLVAVDRRPGGCPVVTLLDVGGTK
jgi:hypothetical protein